jgi:hypothetical protein
MRSKSDDRLVLAGLPRTNWLQRRFKEMRARIATWTERVDTTITITILLTSIYLLRLLRKKR